MIFLSYCWVEKARAFLFGVLGGPIGNAVEKHARETNTNFNDSTLPEIKVINDLLDYDKKHNFDITYDSLYWAVLNSGSSNMTMLSKKSWYQFKFNRDQIENLSKILPTLTGLCEKFKINKWLLIYFYYTWSIFSKLTYI